MRTHLLTAALLTIGLAAAPTFAAKGDKAGGKKADKAAPTSQPTSADAAALFKKLDTDNDGKVSRAEFKPIADKIVAQRTASGGKNADTAGDKTFDKADADHDGSLTSAEFAKIAKRAEKLDSDTAKGADAAKPAKV